MLDLGYVAKDGGQVLNMHDEDFSFIVDYDFEKFDKNIKEEEYYNKEFGSKAKMPIVGGKRALMELVVRSRKLDKYSMISKLKPVK